jgi:hypothetical protein
LSPDQLTATVSHIDEQTSKGVHDTLSQKDSENTTGYFDPSIASCYSIKDLMKQKDPLVTISKRFSLGHVLGKLDVNDIIRIYNPKLAATKAAGFDRS